MADFIPRDLIIDPEFSGLCPALTSEEADYLEAAITADGCRDEIVTWANHNDTILDGHHRYEICRRVDKPFRTKALQFNTREECINWIITAQLGRRNLAEEQKSFLRGKQYQAEKKQGERTDLTSGHFGQKLETATHLAEKHGVSARTIRRDAAFADAIDAIEKVQGADAKAEILSGKSKLGKVGVVTASKLPPKKLEKALKTGKLPVVDKPKSGEQKKDPRLWGEIEGLFGKALNRTDELNRNYCHGNMHRRLIAEIKVCMASLQEWKRAVAK